MICYVDLAFFDIEILEKEELTNEVYVRLFIFFITCFISSSYYFQAYAGKQRQKLYSQTFRLR